MNDINKEINRIIETVIECAKAEVSHEHTSITKTEVLGKSRKENAIRVRCLVGRLYREQATLQQMGAVCRYEYGAQ